MNGLNSINLPPGGKTQTDVWGTPQWLFDLLHAEFDFTLDPCSDGDNAKCARYFDSIYEDGLAQDWGHERVFMNPPYTDCLGWMRKAWASSLAGALVVSLVPVRTDTTWWHEYAMHGEIRLIRGRLKFGAAVTSAPFPSAIVIFRPFTTTPACVGWECRP